jgi:hypothetical protein
MKIPVNRFILAIWVVMNALGVGQVLGQVSVGVNPPQIRWSQIETEGYQIIFPENRYQDASRVANTLDYILGNDSLTLTYPKIRIPIILQNQTVIPNGFVTIGPWRSEYNLNPPQFQFAGITSWLDMLTIHEFRHVQQVANARRGTSGKLLRGVFGQGGWAFYNRAVMPRWFIEGDAVYAETVYSKGGRGRSPDFEREYRALRLSGLQYHYEKASFRSFKHYIPSHYHLGYLVTTYARNEFGPEVWDQILSDTYSKPGLYRFSKAVKNATGSSTKQLYQAAMEDLDASWNQQDSEIRPSKVHEVSKAPAKTFTNYRFPNYISDGTIIAQKSSLNEIRTVYKLENSNEEKLFVPGVSLSEHFSLGGDKLVWSEVRFHPRWTGLNYSIIRLYDFNTRKLHKLTSKSKLSAPGISRDGARIAAVETSPNGKIYLVILDSRTGQQQLRVEVPSGDFISFPRWNENNRTVFLAGRNLDGNFLKVFDIPTESWKELISPSEFTIDRIYPTGKYVFYSSSLTGVQNIFALDITTTEIFQITDSRFGAFDPAVSPNGKKLAYSDYTAMGFRTKEIELTDALWKQPVTPLGQGSNYYLSSISREVGDITNKISNKDYPVAPFNYFTKGLFNIHSWYPIVTTEEFGAAVLSKNIMNSLAITGQFTHNTNENSWKTLVRSSYGAFFPILDLEVSTGERQSAQLLSVTDSLRLYSGQWKEHVFSGGLRVPINLTHGSYPSSISISSRYQHYIVDYLDAITDRSRDENFGAVDVNFSFRRAQTTALQNIYPRWAQTVSVNYQRTLGDRDNQGSIFTLNSSLFFPGVFRNHSLFLTGGYQTEDIVNAYRFEDLFTNARGYGSNPFESVFRISANYTLPLWYPDLALGSLAYFKRLRGNFFYDYSEGELLGLDVPLKSYGVELVTDFRLTRLVDVGFGVRLGRKLDRSPFYVDDSDYFAEIFISSIAF